MEDDCGTGAPGARGWSEVVVEETGGEKIRWPTLPVRMVAIVDVGPA